MDIQFSLVDCVIGEITLAGGKVNALRKALPDDLIAWLQEQGIACDPWKSISPKYGWSLYPALRQRTILDLGPCDGCFRASFVLGERAVAAARTSDLPANLLKQIATARHIAEGTGVRLLVRAPKT